MAVQPVEVYEQDEATGTLTLAAFIESYELLNYKVGFYDPGTFQLAINRNKDDASGIEPGRFVKVPTPGGTPQGHAYYRIDQVVQDLDESGRASEIMTISGREVPGTHLQGRIAYPPPYNDFDTPTDDHDTRTGAVETIIKGYLQANATDQTTPNRISISNLFTYTNATELSVYTTTSQTFLNKRLYLLAIASRHPTGTPFTAPPAVTGGGLTWDHIDDVVNSRYRLWLFQGWADTTATTGAITIDFAGAETSLFINVSCNRVNNSSGVWQSISGSADSITSHTLTLAEFADDTINATFAAWQTNNDVAIGAEATWTELSDVPLAAGGDTALETQWKDAEDLSPSASIAVAGTLMGIAVELAQRTTRQLPRFRTATDQARGPSTTYEARYEALLAPNGNGIIQKLARQGEIGWYVRYDATAKVWLFDMLVGTDRTTTVFFDVVWDTVRKQRWMVSDADRFTHAVVGGQNEGIERTIRHRELTPVFGYDRIERFVDARDLELNASLDARGDAMLHEFSFDERFEVEVYEFGSFRPGTHWNLGDLVTVRNAKWNATAFARIVQISYDYERSGQPVLAINVERHWPSLESRTDGSGDPAKPADLTDWFKQSHLARHKPVSLGGTGQDIITPGDIGAFPATPNMIALFVANPGTGWQFCNGTNGSPNIGNRFVRFDTLANAGTTGGSGTDSPSSHSGSLSHSAHSSEAHSHDVVGSGGGSDSGGTLVFNLVTDSDSHAHDAHTAHSLSGLTHDTVTIDPPWFKFAPYMKL